MGNCASRKTNIKNNPKVKQKIIKKLLFFNMNVPYTPITAKATRKDTNKGVHVIFKKKMSGILGFIAPPNCFS